MRSRTGQVSGRLPIRQTPSWSSLAKWSGFLVISVNVSCVVVGLEWGENAARATGGGCAGAECGSVFPEEEGMGPTLSKVKCPQLGTWGGGTALSPR